MPVLTGKRTFPWRRGRDRNGAVVALGAPAEERGAEHSFVRVVIEFGTGDSLDHGLGAASRRHILHVEKAGVGVGLERPHQTKPVILGDEGMP